MRSAEKLAYWHSGLAALAYFLMANSHDNGYVRLSFLATAVFIAPLGWAIGRRQSAAAAAVLVTFVLGVTIWQIVSGRTPAVLIVFLIAWRYAQAFNAAREYASLRDVTFESQQAAT